MVNIPQTRRTLLLALLLLALGSLAVHVKVHPSYITDETSGSRFFVFPYFLSNLLSAVDVFLVTFLFSRKSTAAWGYMLNGLLVIYGTVLMVHFGWAQLAGTEAGLTDYILFPTLHNVLLAWGDFFLGAALYRMWFMEPPKPKAA